MITHYQQQRWQLHTRIERVKHTLETLEQQLQEIDVELLALEPQTTAPHKQAKPAVVMTVSENQGTLLAIAAG